MAASTSLSPDELIDRARDAARKRWAKPENVDRRVDAVGEHIRRLVETAPPLTVDQVERLRALLPPAGAA